MADSDSGTHVTDVSESLPDDFDLRKEGTLNSFLNFEDFQTTPYPNLLY